MNGHCELSLNVHVCGHSDVLVTCTRQDGLVCHDNFWHRAPSFVHSDTALLVHLWLHDGLRDHPRARNDLLHVTHQRLLANPRLLFKGDMVLLHLLGHHYYFLYRLYGWTVLPLLLIHQFLFHLRYVRCCRGRPHDGLFDMCSCGDHLDSCRNHILGLQMVSRDKASLLVGMDVAVVPRMVRR